MKHMDFFKKIVEQRRKNEKKKPLFDSSMIIRREQTPLERETFQIVNQPFNADIKVHFTEKEVEADLLVYVSQYPRRAKNRAEIWHYADYISDSGTKIFPVPKAFMADLSVCIVDEEYQARWLRKKRVKSRSRKIGM